MQENRTTDVFNHTAATYDVERARLIPGFTAFYKAALDEIPRTADHVLDLGTGTGLFAAMIRERLQGAYLHLIDNSEAMLAQAKQRFAGDHNVLFHLADYTVAPWGSQYDAIVSALSIHHIEDTGKRALFARIRAALKPEGVFVNAEQILAATPSDEASAKQDWLAEVRALGATEDQIAASLLRQTEDRCATVTDQLAWLREAGFMEVSCPLRHGRFAVFCARR